MLVHYQAHCKLSEGPDGAGAGKSSFLLVRLEENRRMSWYDRLACLKMDNLLRFPLTRKPPSPPPFPRFLSTGFLQGVSPLVWRNKLDCSFLPPSSPSSFFLYCIDWQLGKQTNTVNVWQRDQPSRADLYAPKHTTNTYHAECVYGPVYRRGHTHTHKHTQYWFNINRHKRRAEARVETVEKDTHTKRRNPILYRRSPPFVVSLFVEKRRKKSLFSIQVSEWDEKGKKEDDPHYHLMMFTHSDNVRKGPSVLFCRGLNHNFLCD